MAKVKTGRKHASVGRRGTGLKGKRTAKKPVRAKGAKLTSGQKETMRRFSREIGNLTRQLKEKRYRFERAQRAKRK